MKWRSTRESHQVPPRFSAALRGKKNRSRSDRRRSRRPPAWRPGSAGRRERGLTPRRGITDRRIEVLSREGLDLDQLRRERLEHVAVVLQDRAGLLVALVDDPPHFDVDEVGGALGDELARNRLAAQERALRR